LIRSPVKGKVIVVELKSKERNMTLIPNQIMKPMLEMKVSVRNAYRRVKKAIRVGLEMNSVMEEHMNKKLDTVILAVLKKESWVTNTNIRPIMLLVAALKMKI